MDYAALFPGQGSQEVGMGARLFEECPDLLGESADEILGWSLREVCLDGPLERLTRTDIAQPALFALSFAAWTVWRRRVTTPPAAGAGHSLGEYTALAAAGAIDFFEGLALVAARGRAMAEAATETSSGMAAVIGAEPDQLEAICAGRRREGGRLWVANLNAPGQTVLAGASEDLLWLGAVASEVGLRRVVPLEVAGAFHTPLMEPAVEPYRSAVESVQFSPTTFPVWSNVDAVPHADDIADKLVRQLTAPVRFAESLEGVAASGVTTFVHLGPGTVTAGMARRTVADAATAAVADFDSASNAAVDLSVD